VYYYLYINCSSQHIHYKCHYEYHECNCFDTKVCGVESGDEHAEAAARGSERPVALWGVT
jgi:hypothetical protein